MKRSETVGQSAVNRLVAGFESGPGSQQNQTIPAKQQPPNFKSRPVHCKKPSPPRAKRTNTPEHRWSISSSIADHPRLSGQIAHTVRVYPGLQSSYIQRLTTPSDYPTGLSKREYSAGPKLGERLVPLVIQLLQPPPRFYSLWSKRTRPLATPDEANDR